MQLETLRAGAGRAEIQLPESLFPTEGFYGVHDVLYARVLLLESGYKFAFVSLELTSLPAEQVIALQKATGKASDLLPENVVICATHTFSAPHFLPAHLCKTAADQQKNDSSFQTIKAAIDKAASQVLPRKRNPHVLAASLELAM